MRRAKRLLALLAVLSLAMGGCALRGPEAVKAVDDIPLPTPESEPENMILGEQLSLGSTEVSLYLPTSDSTGFSTVNRSVPIESGVSLPESAVKALLAALNAGESLGLSTGDIRLLSFEYACGIATANLSIDARGAQSAQELLALVTAIDNTLLGIDGVRGASVLIGGQSEGFAWMPLGVQTAIVDSVTASYAQLQTERDRFSAQESPPLVRRAALYFPANRGRWLIPELREVRFESGSLIVPLIDALKAGPQMSDCAIASIPEGVDLLNAAPEVETLASGERVLTLDFSSTLANYLAFSGMEVWELAGSVSLTLCSFLPELDGVRIMVNGDPITMCELDERILRFPGGIIRRADFSGRIGSVATLFLAGEDDLLQPIERAVSMRSAYSPHSLLTVLFAQAAPDESGMRFPIPGSVYAEDLLGVRLSEGIAHVNLSSGFYRCCQTLDEITERNLIYSMVNTLCQLEEVRGVRFYIEGLAADTLAGGIYLKSVLLPNPGIVAETTAPKMPGEEILSTEAPLATPRP